MWITIFCGDIYFRIFSYGSIFSVDMHFGVCSDMYGVATISRIDKILGLFCRIASLLWGSFVKEICNLIDPTNISQRIVCGERNARKDIVRVVYVCMSRRARKDIVRVVYVCMSYMSVCLCVCLSETQKES